MKKFLLLNIALWLVVVGFVLVQRGRTRLVNANQATGFVMGYVAAEIDNRSYVKGCQHYHDELTQAYFKDAPPDADIKLATEDVFTTCSLAEFGGGQ